jgi:glutamate--cysteine ligase
MTHDQLHDCESVHGYVGRICFKNGPPTKIGAELEFLLSGADPREPVSLARVRAALLPAPPFPGGSKLTFEPGGQVELSSQAAPGLTALIATLQADVDHLVGLLASAGIGILGSAADPCRPPRRQLRSNRYDAMEAYFDDLEAGVPEADRVGRAMMASTAATQVNLDTGTDLAGRWRLLHDIGPVLVAAFANSPDRLGRPTGWKSSRQQIWQRLDPTRTAAPQGSDPVSAYSRLVLEAPVMMQPARGTFATWVLSDDPPTTADLDLHLTTLFPPVRPRGWFEVRYLDAQPLEWWPVPLAVLSALVDDPVAASLAAEAAEPARDRWMAAGREGLDDQVLREAARRCFRIALDSLGRHDPLLVGVVSRFTEQYVDRGRCPADDTVAQIAPQEVG